MAKIIPATEDKPATVELTPEEQERVEHAAPETFLAGASDHQILHFRVSENEVLTDVAQARLWEMNAC